MDRRCWVNFKCFGVLLIWIVVKQGPNGACEILGHFYSFIYLLFSLVSPSVWETARYRLKEGLERLLNPKQTTNHFLNVIKENFSYLTTHCA